jgi:ATP-dependent RNA helicase DeaD
VQARRLEQTRGALRKAIAGGGLEPMRAFVTSLAAEFDVMDVAAAAVKLAHEANDGATPIPISSRRTAASREQRRPERARPAPRREDAGSRQPTDVLVLRINAGARAGVRPADLVGAITGEARVDANVLGRIDIADNYSLVEVDPAVIDRVMKALSGAEIRGRRVDVRRFRPGSPR